MVTLVKKIYCGHNGKRVLESWHIANIELWNQTRVDNKAKSIKSKENYLCIVHYTWYAYDCSKNPSKDRPFIASKVTVANFFTQAY